jgi:hypothetical protein
MRGMVISRQDRRTAREPLVRDAFGANANAVLDLLELAEFAWHDCYGEATPPEAVVSDILTCGQGDLATAVRAVRLAVEDSRDLRLWADDVRRAGSA